MAAQRVGATHVCLSVSQSGLQKGVVRWEDLYELLVVHREKVKIVTFSHISNAVGLVTNPGATAEQIVTWCKELHMTPPLIVVDGAQAAARFPVRFDHMPIDVYCISAHKMYGPMGIGAALVKRKYLDRWQPVLTGGGMIDVVSCERTTFAADLTDRWQAGTPDVAGLVGWAAACAYLHRLGWSTIQEHLAWCGEQLQEILQQFAAVRPLVQFAPHTFGGVSSFTYDGVHAHDVAQVLDSVGVAVRSGHHCTMPLHQALRLAATTRISVGVYTIAQDFAQLAEGLHKVAHVFSQK
jgi:cysteine desulfurase/selenocysteine lyase